MTARVALMTPPGKGALATLRVTGPGAWPLARTLFRPMAGALPEEPEVGRFWLGKLGEEVAEEAVLAVRGSAAAVCVEVHVHGGREGPRFVLELFTSRGATAVGWEELPDEAGENTAPLNLLPPSPPASGGEHGLGVRGVASRLGGGVLSHTLSRQAAGVLVRTTTVRTAGIALDQYHGAFARALEQVTASLAAGQVARARELLGELLRCAGVGLHLTTPWRVVVAGPPNVGKSSLVNALAGYQRSIVAATAGTTRDVVATRLALDGWPVEVVDTAGLRQGGESLEALGIEQARAAAAAADLVLWVMDASAGPVWPAEGAAKVRLVVNKTDVQPAWDLAAAGDAPRVSARTGDGVAGLVERLSGWLVPEPPPAGAAVPFTAELVSRLEEADRLLGGEAADEALRHLQMLLEG